MTLEKTTEASVCDATVEKANSKIPPALYV